MKCTPLKVLPEIKLIRREVHKDARGYFLETFHADRYASFGIPARFVQDNRSLSVRNVIRGLHYQLKKPQGKLIEVAEGSVFDVAVDIRRGSSTFGRWESVVLSADNFDQLYIPAGFAHGICVLSERAVVVYKCTDYYDTDDERGIAWNDPLFGIDWPVAHPILSEKDGKNPFLADIPDEDLPVYRGL